MVKISRLHVLIATEFYIFLQDVGYITLFRLDEETEELHHDRVPLSLGKVLQQARASKNWTQKDLSAVSLLLLDYLLK